MRLFVFIILMYFTNHLSSSQSASEIIKEMYDGSYSVVEQADDLDAIGVEAVWLASSLAGYSTTNGTLTQSASNPQEWSYSQDPSNKLVIKFGNGKEMNYTFITINGYVDGTSEDFLDSHSMEYDVEIPGSVNLHINSVAQPQSGKIELSKNISGTTQYQNDEISVNLASTGNKDVTVEYGIALGDYNYQNSGSIQSLGINYSVNESYSTSIGHNSSTGIYVQDRNIWSNNSASGNFGSFTFQNLYCFYIGGTAFPDSAAAGIYNQAIETSTWEARGTLLKDNQFYGNIQFDSSPVENTYGSILIANCTDGNKYFLDNLLKWFVTSLHKNTLSPDHYILYQNYPNPFNPITNIRYSVPESGANQITNLTVFDMLGKKVSVLVNEIKKPGQYSVQFDASNLASGIYFYRLTGKNTVVNRKMAIVK